MRTRAAVRYDGTLRVVMWLDAFWSLIAGLAWLVLLPAVALLDFGAAARTVAAVVSIVGAVFLGACGAVTFGLLTLRMQHGHYYLPPDLRLPLPRPFRAWSNAAARDDGGHVRSALQRPRRRR